MANNRRIPGIPSVPSNTDAATYAFLSAVKENVEIREGVRRAGVAVGDGSNFDGWRRRAVTLGMLVSVGVLSEAQAKQLYAME